MRFLVMTAGSHGDIHPFLAVARELAARGHEIDFLVHPHFHADARAAGFEPIPLSPDIDFVSILKHPDLMNGYKGGRIVLDTILGSIPQACQTLTHMIHSRRPDAVVAHQVCLGARWICEREGVPLATGVLAPLAWLSRSAPFPSLQRSPGRFYTIAARMLFTAAVPVVRFLTDRRLNAIRQSMGFPPEKAAILNDFLGGDISLGLWSPALRGPTPHDPPRGVICGFPWYDGSTGDPILAPRLEDFLRQGPPPIVFCLGTAASHSAGNFHSIAARAATELNRRAILLVGKGVDVPCNLPGGVIAAEYAPFSLLFPRAGAIVHHGGIGSIAQSLRAGRPTLVIPHAHDQFNNALLVHRLGAARILPRPRVTVARLARELAPLLENPPYTTAARTFAARISDEDGAAVAADHLESLAGARSSTAPTPPPRETQPAPR